MTPEQLEIAAREFCRLTGDDPDETIPDVGFPEILDALKHLSPRWKFVARILDQHEKAHEAIWFATHPP